MPKKPDVRYENNYRFTPEQIKRKTRWVYILWAITAVGGFVADFVFYGIISAAYNTNGDDSLLPKWTDTVGGLLILSGIVFVPLLYAAWMGGRAIHRWGPLGTLSAIIGIILLATGSTFGIVWFYAGMVLAIFGVILTFYLAVAENLPVWLQLPILNSPRLYINKPVEKKPKK